MANVLLALGKPRVKCTSCLFVRLTWMEAVSLPLGGKCKVDGRTPDIKIQCKHFRLKSKVHYLNTSQSIECISVSY